MLGSKCDANLRINANLRIANDANVRMHAKTPDYPGFLLYIGQIRLKYLTFGWFWSII